MFEDKKTENVVAKLIHHYTWFAIQKNTFSKQLEILGKFSKPNPKSAKGMIFSVKEHFYISIIREFLYDTRTVQNKATEWDSPALPITTFFSLL